MDIINFFVTIWQLIYPAIEAMGITLKCFIEQVIENPQWLILIIPTLIVSVVSLFRKLAFKKL